MLYQHIPIIGVGYYVLTLECSGDVYLKTGGSGSCFEYGVYSWNGDSGRHKTSNQEMMNGWTDENIKIPDCSVVTLVDELERIQFSSGFYKIIVKAKSTGTKDISFAMTDGSSISTCKLQKLPNSKASESAKRGCYNAIVTENQQPQWFNWKNEYLSTKTFSFYYDWAYNHEYNIQITIPDRTGITNVAVKWNKINTTSETINYPFEIGVPINISYQGDNMPMFKADVTLSYGTTTYALTKTLTVINNDEFLLDIYDSFGALEESILDFSGTKIGSTYQLNKNWNFKKHKYRLKELNISNTQSSDLVENITSISDSINISNTNVGGFFSQLSSIPRVICENTNISKYGTGQSYYAVGIEPYIVWKNSKTQIEEASLNLLLNTLANSNTYNGYLDIAGDNPEITDTTALEHISNLVDSKGWTVLYNSAEEDWTYEGVMTVGQYIGTFEPLKYSYGYMDDTIPGAIVVAGELDPHSIFLDLCYFGYEYNVIDLWVYGGSTGVLDIELENIQINGVNYTMMRAEDDPIHWRASVETNPFPAVGETCEIKLKYTLVPPL